MSELAAIIVNPTKFDDASKLRAAAQARAEQAGRQLRWLETTPSDPGGAVAAQALAQGCELIIACGGDGTITACADALAAAGSPARLAVVPVGTGNLFARNLGLPLDLDDALAVAFGTSTRRVDVLKSGDRHFIVMAGLGLDAALIRDTSDTLKAQIGWPAYLSGLTKALKRTRRTRFTLTVDDQPVIRTSAVGVLVGNVGNLQGGIQLLSNAQPDDGLLHVIVLAPQSPSHWVGLIASTLTRRAGKSRATVAAQGRRVVVTADQPAPIEFDGEYAGQAKHLEVTVCPAALTLCCPSA